MAPLSQPPRRRGGRPTTNSSASIIAPPGTATTYCKTCGRLVSPRADRNMDTLVYCSVACRKKKPTQFDRRIEEAFVERLTVGKEEFVLCSVVEEQVYAEVEREAVRKMMEEVEIDGGNNDGRTDKGGEDQCASSVAKGKSKGRRRQGSEDHGDGDENQNDEEGVSFRLEYGNIVPNDTEYAEESKTVEKTNHEKSVEGMERAKRRERVKQAARRVVVFREGYICRSKNGKQLEVSHAHGDWGVSPS